MDLDEILAQLKLPGAAEFDVVLPRFWLQMQPMRSGRSQGAKMQPDRSA
jgi:hypothetical protein